MDALNPNQIQLSQLMQQLGFGHDLFNAAPTGTGQTVGRTFVAASPWAHISDLASKLLGGYEMGQANKGQSDLAQKILGQRQEYGTALDTAMNGGSGGTLGAEGGGMARPPDPGAASKLLLQGAGSDDPGMEKIVQTLMGQRKMGIEEMHLQNQLRHQQVLEGQGQGRLDQGNRRLEESEKALALRGVRWNPNTMQYENISGKIARPPKAGAATATPDTTGQAGDEATRTPVAPAGVPGAVTPQPDPPLDKFSSTRMHQLGQALDPYAQRGGLKGQMDIINRAKRLNALVTDEKGNLKPLDSRQTEEVAIGLNAMLSGSNTGAQSQVEALVPHTVWGDVKKLQERITNEPTPLDQAAFIKRMADTVAREEGVASDTVRGAISQRLPEYADLRKKFKNKFDTMLKVRGIDPAWVDENGAVNIPKDDPQTAGTDALRKKYGL